MSEDMYRRRYNDELYQIYQEPDIVQVVKLRRLAWAGHVVRRDENHPVQRAFKGDFYDGSRKRGRPQNSWKADVDRDCATFGLQNWQREAKDRSKFKKFLEEAKARSRAWKVIESKVK
jgi:hypothetical protein